MKLGRRFSSLTAAFAISLGMLSAMPAVASAQADAGALQACDAVETGPGVGYVPPNARGVAYIQAIQTSRGTYRLLCGMDKPRVPSTFN